MSAKEKDTQKSTEIIPSTPVGNLLSFDEFDNFFDGFLSRKWPRLLDGIFLLGLIEGFQKWILSIMTKK